MPTVHVSSFQPFESRRGIGNTGRFVARLLKHLLRAWGIRCVALRETLPKTGGPGTARAGENEAPSCRSGTIQGEQDA